MDDLENVEVLENLLADKNREIENILNEIKETVGYEDLWEYRYSLECDLIELRKEYDQLYNKMINMI
jgi:hypothetical protein